MFLDSRDKAECSSIRNTDEMKTDAARKAMRKTLKKRGLQITAHDARKG